MLSQLDQKKIKFKLNNIYKNLKTSKEISFYHKEIISVIKKFNKNNVQKKKTINEKTSVLICYGDSIFDNTQKNSIQVFQNFYQKS